MKKIYVILTMMFASISGHALMPVEIIQEGLGTTAFYITAWGQYVNMVNNGANTIRLQLHALEKLGEGGWDGFISYFNYQGRALGALGNAINSANTAQFFNDAPEGGANMNNWLEDFKAVKFSNSEMSLGLDEMANMFYELSDATSNTKLFVQETEARIKALQNIQEEAQYATSGVQQSELLFQATTLMANQNEAILQQLINNNTVLSNEQKYAQQARTYFSEVDKKSTELPEDAADSLGTRGRNYEEDMLFYEDKMRESIQ